MVLRCRFLPVMDRIFAKKGEATGCPKVRLATVWFGQYEIITSNTHFSFDHSSPVRWCTDGSVIGTNDGVIPSDTETKDVPVDAFERNMNKIVELLVDPSSPYAIAHDTHPLSIILITPPMYNEEMRTGQGTLVTDERNYQYCQAVLRVAEGWKKREAGKRWRIASIDLYSSLEKARETGDATRFYTYAYPSTFENWCKLTW